LSEYTAKLLAKVLLHCMHQQYKQSNVVSALSAQCAT